MQFTYDSNFARCAQLKYSFKKGTRNDVNFEHGSVYIHRNFNALRIFELGRAISEYLEPEMYSLNDLDSYNLKVLHT